MPTNVSCSQQQTIGSLNDDHLANSHVSGTSCITPLITHAMGDIGYFDAIKKAPWVLGSFWLEQILRFFVWFCLPNVRCEQSYSRANGANVQSNVRYVLWSERSPVFKQLIPF